MNRFKETKMCFVLIALIAIAISFCGSVKAYYQFNDSVTVGVTTKPLNLTETVTGSTFNENGNHVVVIPVQLSNTSNFPITYTITLSNPNLTFEGGSTTYTGTILANINTTVNLNIVQITEVLTETTNIIVNLNTPYSREDTLGPFTVNYVYDNEGPNCTWGNWSDDNISSGYTSTITLTCTDEAGITTSTFTPTMSDPSAGTLSAPILGGTSTEKTFTFTLTAGNVATSTALTLPANTIADSYGNYATSVTSTAVNVGMQVTFDPQGGTIPAGASWTGSGSTAKKGVIIDEVYGDLPAPTKSGYTFLGWSTEPNPNLEYIEATGTQYINVNYYHTPDTEVVADFQYTALTSQQTLFGGTNPAGGDVSYAMYINSAGKWAYAYTNGSGGFINTGIDADTARHTIEFNRSGAVKIDSSYDEYIQGTMSETALYPMYLMANDRQGVNNLNNNSKVKMYSFQVYELGAIQRDLVPNYRGIDGTIGMYDQANDVFYDNAGTATFKKGNFAEPLTTASTEVTLNENHTLYAIWEKNLTVTFDAAGGTIPSGANWTGSGASATKILHYGDNYGTLPVPTRTGYIFLGWADASENLPAAYQEVEYLENTGGQYIDLGVYGKQNDKVEVTYSVSNHQSGIFGVLEASKYFGLVDASELNQKMYFYYGGANGVTTQDIVMNHIYTAEIDERVATIDGTDTITIASSTFTSTITMHLFGFNRNGNEFNMAGTRIYSFKLYEGDTQLMDLVPCYRISDNVAGMYNKVDGTFYTNDGSGTFAIGNIVGEVTSSTVIETNENHTIYARWGAGLTVTFDAAGGTIPSGASWTGSGSTASKNFAYDKEYGALPTPTRSGYKFIGWSYFDGYQQVEYVKSTGLEYIDTGTTANQDTTIEVKYIHHGGDAFIYGARQAHKNREFGVLNSTAGDLYYDYGTTANIHSGYTDGVMRVVKQQKNKNFLDDIRLSTATAETFTTPGNIYIFATYHNGTVSQGKAIMSLYYFKMWNNGTLIRDLVPVYRASDYTVGMYDAVNNVFYQNAGTGAFTKGENVSVTSTTKAEKTANHTLYAIWEEDLTVTFDATGGTIPSGADWTGSGSTVTKGFTYQEAYGTLPTPTRDGYKFAGWSYFDGYQQIISLTATGTQYINAGFIPTQNYLAEVKYKYISGSGGIYGTRQAAQNRTFTYLHGSDGTIYYDYGTQRNTYTGYSSGVVYTVKQYQRMNYLNDALKGYATANSFTAPGNMFVFAVNNNGTAAALTQSTIYYAKFWNDTTLVRDFVPAYRMTDLAAGFYDQANNVFYPNAGTGEFTKGINVSITESTKANKTANHTLYALWKEDLTATLDANGGTVASGASWTGSGATVTKVVRYGDAYGTLPEPTRSGYMFLGWATTPQVDLTYIESTGTQYINTNYKPNKNTGIVANFQYTNLTTQQALFGTDNTSGIYYRFYINGSGNWAYAFNDGSGNWFSTGLAATTGNLTLQFNRSNKVIIGSYNDSIDGSVSKTAVDPLLIFARGGPNNAVSMQSRVKMYSFKMYNSSTLIRNYVPSYRGSDGAIGLYDKVYNIFYENVGTGFFKKGDFVNDFTTETSTVETNANHTLYAIWIKSSTVTFDPSGGTVSPTTKSVLYGETYGTLPTPTKEGYNFVGWSHQENTLPVGYKKIDYVQSTGRQYINTGFTPNQDTATELQYKYLGGGSPIYGSRVDYQDHAYAFINDTSGNIYFDYNATRNTYTGYSPGTVHTIKQTKNVNYIDGTQVGSATYATFTAPDDMYLFTMNNNGTASTRSEAQVYYFKIWDNGTLVRDYLPVVRNSDGAIGLYDTVNNTFKTNTSRLIKGGYSSAFVVSTTNVAREDDHTLYAVWEPVPTTPTCTITTTNGYDTSKTLTINVTTHGSPIITNGYSWNGTTWGSSNTKTVSEAGTYTAYVIDEVGEIGTCSITIKSRTEYRKRTCDSITYSAWTQSGSGYVTGSCTSKTEDLSKRECTGKYTAYAKVAYGNWTQSGTGYISSGSCTDNTGDTTKRVCTGKYTLYAKVAYGSWTVSNSGYLTGTCTANTGDTSKRECPGTYTAIAVCNGSSHLIDRGYSLSTCNNACTSARAGLNGGSPCEACSCYQEYVDSTRIKCSQTGVKGSGYTLSACNTAGNNLCSISSGHSCYPEYTDYTRTKCSQTGVLGTGYTLSACNTVGNNACSISSGHACYPEYKDYTRTSSCGSWSSWSGWGTTSYTASSSQQVQTRTTYGK